jgi:opacity protein-like surface antigen
MKKLLFAAPLLFCVSSAYGQNAVDLNIGFGSAFDSSNNQGIDSNTFLSCSSAASSCLKTPDLSGFFLGFGGDIMFKEHFGGGFEYNVQPARQTYGPFQSRVSFIDVNGIYDPIIKKRYTVQLQGGIGAARTSFAYSQSSCVGTAVCSSSTQALGNSNHFQVHVGAGVQIAITEHVFVRPQFDLHYAPNLTDQFGRNSVPEATVWVGYHWGSR